MTDTDPKAIWPGIAIIQEAGRQIDEAYKSGGIPFPRVERIITAALHKYKSAVKLEVLREAARRQCGLCKDRLVVRKRSVWSHPHNEPCEAHGIHDLIAEIERREDDKERRI